jgi:Cu/Ag efflux pump CusA
MLGGMVVNNGIVLIDFMNVLRRSGVALREAVFPGLRRAVPAHCDVKHDVGSRACCPWPWG